VPTDDATDTQQPLRDGVRVRDAEVHPARNGSRSDGVRVRAYAHVESLLFDGVDTGANPLVVVFVATSVAQAQRWYDRDKVGASRMAIGNAIRLMCRAVKSREGDHFGIAIGFANEFEGKVPVIPDWAKDGHTYEGKKMGRGLAYFREHSAQLVPPVAKDRYEDEAYRLLELTMKQPKRKSVGAAVVEEDLFE
jgi:hypothetical protein